MKSNFDKCLALMLKHEGGFVNHPKDPGGMTNLGVTKTTWEEWTRKPSDEAEMRSLTPEMVAPLYKARFWDRVKADDLPSGVDYAVFDAAVNSGPGRAARWLQECVGVTADGAIGPKTLQAVNSYPGDLQSDYCDKRLKFLQSLPTFPTFGRGWTRRVEDVKSTRLL
jgi:hypothetical protein